MQMLDSSSNAESFDNEANLAKPSELIANFAHPDLDRRIVAIEDFKRRSVTTSLASGPVFLDALHALAKVISHDPSMEVRRCACQAFATLILYSFAKRGAEDQAATTEYLLKWIWDEETDYSAGKRSGPTTLNDLSSYTVSQIIHSKHLLGSRIAAANAIILGIIPKIKSNLKNPRHDIRTIESAISTSTLLAHDVPSSISEYDKAAEELLSFVLDGEYKPEHDGALRRRLYRLLVEVVGSAALSTICKTLKALLKVCQDNASRHWLEVEALAILMVKVLGRVIIKANIEISKVVEESLLSVLKAVEHVKEADFTVAENLVDSLRTVLIWPEINWYRSVSIAARRVSWSLLESIEASCPSSAMEISAATNSQIGKTESACVDQDDWDIDLVDEDMEDADLSDADNGSEETTSGTRVVSWRLRQTLIAAFYPLYRISVAWDSNATSFLQRTWKILRTLCKEEKALKQSAFAAMAETLMCSRKSVLSKEVCQDIEEIFLSIASAPNERVIDLLIYLAEHQLSSQIGGLDRIILTLLQSDVVTQNKNFEFKLLYVWAISDAPKSTEFTKAVENRVTHPDGPPCDPLTWERVCVKYCEVLREEGREFDIRLPLDQPNLDQVALLCVAVELGIEPNLDTVHSWLTSNKCGVPLNKLVNLILINCKGASLEWLPPTSSALIIFGTSSFDPELLERLREHRLTAGRTLTREEATVALLTTLCESDEVLGLLLNSMPSLDASSPKTIDFCLWLCTFLNEQRPQLLKMLLLRTPPECTFLGVIWLVSCATAFVLKDAFSDHLRTVRSRPHSFVLAVTFWLSKLGESDANIEILLTSRCKDTPLNPWPILKYVLFHSQQSLVRMLLTNCPLILHWVPLDTKVPIANHDLLTEVCNRLLSSDGAMESDQRMAYEACAVLAENAPSLIQVEDPLQRYICQLTLARRCMPAHIAEILKLKAHSVADLPFVTASYNFLVWALQVNKMSMIMPLIEIPDLLESMYETVKSDEKFTIKLHLGGGLTEAKDLAADTRRGALACFSHLCCVVSTSGCQRAIMEDCSPEDLQKLRDIYPQTIERCIDAIQCGVNEEDHDMAFCGHDLLSRLLYSQKDGYDTIAAKADGLLKTMKSVMKYFCSKASAAVTSNLVDDRIRRTESSIAELEQFLQASPSD